MYVPTTRRPMAVTHGWRDGAPVYDRGDTVCVIGAGASGLTAIKNLTRARVRRRLLRAGDRRRRRLELAARPQPGLRQHAPDLVEAVHPVPGLPDAGRLAGLPAPHPGAGLPRALRRPLRPARRTSGSAPRWSRSSRPTDDRWDVTTRSTGGLRRRAHPPVRRRGGRQRAQLVAEAAPTYEGLDDFRGEVIHASAYKDAAQLRGQQGAGRRRRQHRLRHRGRGRPAGGADCWHSTRRGYWYAPKYAFGRPADQVNDPCCALRLPLRAAPVAVPPDAAADRRRPDPLRPARRPTTRCTRPTRSPTASSSTTSGTARSPRCPTSRGSSRNSVELTDGREIEPDLVVLATGYLPRFEFLAPEVLGVDEHGRPRLYLHAFPPAPPDAGRRRPAAARLRAVPAGALADRGGRPLAAAARGGPGRATAFWSRAAARPRRTGGGPGPRSRTPPGTGSRSATPTTCGRCRRRSTSWSRRHERGRGSCGCEDWARPVPAGAPRGAHAPRRRPTRASRRCCSCPGFGHGAWAFAEHWLEHTAERGFPAYAVSLRGHGAQRRRRPRPTLRAYAHDVVQVAAGLPRQAVLVGHGAGALVVAHALARYPARAGGAGRAGLRRLGDAGRGARAQPVRHAAGAVRRAAAAAPPASCSAGSCPTRRPGRTPAGWAGRRRRAQWQLLAGRAPGGRRSATRRCWWSAAPTTGWCRASALDRVARRYGGAPLLFPGMGHDLMLDARWREPIDAILDWLEKELAANRRRSAGGGQPRRSRRQAAGQRAVGGPGRAR